MSIDPIDPFDLGFATIAKCRATLLDMKVSDLLKEINGKESTGKNEIAKLNLLGRISYARKYVKSFFLKMKGDCHALSSKDGKEKWEQAIFYFLNIKESARSHLYTHSDDLIMHITGKIKKTKKGVLYEELHEKSRFLKSAKVRSFDGFLYEDGTYVLYTSEGTTLCGRIGETAPELSFTQRVPDLHLFMKYQKTSKVTAELSIFTEAASRIMARPFDEVELGKELLALEEEL